MPRPMGGGPGGHHATAKAKDFKGTTKKLIKGYLGKYKIKLLIVAIFAIASTIFTIVGPKVLGNATTEIYNGIISKISRVGHHSRINRCCTLNIQVIKHSHTTNQTKYQFACR